jgi:hypothetical protein
MGISSLNAYIHFTNIPREDHLALQQNSDAECTAFMILQSAVNNPDFRGVGGSDQNCG